MATRKSTKISVPTETIVTDPGFTLPQESTPARPHNMPRRLLNIPASRTDTAGDESVRDTYAEG